MPKLSIITVNLNNAEGLQKTIKSVLSQTFTDFEYILIDGCSIDESVEVIKGYGERLTYWVSEPDLGIYNGMNKGILKANGEYLLFLNSGDYLNNFNVLKDVFIKNFTEDLILGSVIFNSGDKQELFEIPDINNLTFRYFINSTIPHPGAFIKQSLFKKLGYFNEEYIISSDWEFFLIAIFYSGASLRKIPEIISVFDRNGISSLPENASLVKNERKKILQKYFSGFLPDYEYLEYLEKVNGEMEYKIQHGFWNFAAKIINKLKIK
jgi:glycosyltransferase involved in cell wall biosynthesis